MLGNAYWEINVTVTSTTGKSITKTKIPSWQPTKTATTASCR